MKLDDKQPNTLTSAPHIYGDVDNVLFTMYQQS